jgi:hypothetical protein
LEYIHGKPGFFVSKRRCRRAGREVGGLHHSTAIDNVALFFDGMIGGKRKLVVVVSDR